MMFKLLLVLVMAAFLFPSCEKGVEFKLDDVGPKLVVEATIENGKAPVVYLSRSQGYFSNINLADLANSFVHNAEVYVSNGVTTHKLKEYTQAMGAYNFYYYSNDPASASTAVVGAVNQQYSLRIVSEGKEYNATTRIPDTTRRIDSLFWKPAPVTFYNDQALLMLKSTDRQGLGDYTRYFTRRNSELFYPPLNSVYDDQVVENTTFTVPLDRGVPRNIGGDYQYFYRGDTVTLKLCNIDKATYDFWRTMEFTYASVGNPFSSPTKVLGNLSGGALGYFGGYAAQYRTLIIPR